MTPKSVIRFGGVALIVLAMAMLVRTGDIASSLGAIDGTDRAFWFQLTFMRLFATSLAGLGAILIWCSGQLSSSQQNSLTNLMGCVLGAIGLMAVVQQIALWNSSAGWVLAGSFLGAAAICALSSVRRITA